MWPASRKAILPIQVDLQSEEDSDVSVDDCMDGYIKWMNKFKDDLFCGAKENIKNAQFKQKQYYDRKRRDQVI